MLWKRIDDVIFIAIALSKCSWLLLLLIALFLFQYIFFVAAKDQDGDMLARPLTVTVIVEDINDNPPVCDKALTKFEVQENEVIGMKALYRGELSSGEMSVVFKNADHFVCRDNHFEFGQLWYVRCISISFFHMIP